MALWWFLGLRVRTWPRTAETFVRSVFEQIDLDVAAQVIALELSDTL
jgi:hypothetical protein